MDCRAAELWSEGSVSFKYLSGMKQGNQSQLWSNKNCLFYSTVITFNFNSAENIFIQTARFHCDYRF